MNIRILLSFVTCMALQGLSGQNPVVRDQFTADPSARVFNGRMYLFPSHDIPAPEGKNLRKDWFCMADYHVFSSDDLAVWNDHGVIVSQEKVAWVDSASYSMWAPDCVERNGKYYFYFPANKRAQGPGARRGFGIGVAVAERPEGPYVPHSEPIQGIFGIDPNILIDQDGQAYIYWSMGQIFVARLKENMLELDSEPLAIPGLPQKGLKEGPWVFERNGNYYLTFPHVENKTERLEYAMGGHPMGPFTMTGVIMDELPSGCWTNHQSITEYKGQWYLFYHDKDLSPGFDKNRSVRIDSLFFNDDGTIRKVIPTHRGVGINPATGTLEVDRYSSRHETGTAIAYVDTANPFKGWKAQLLIPGAWLQYNAVDFGRKKLKSVQAMAASAGGGILQVRIDHAAGPLLAEMTISPGGDWMQVSSRLRQSARGIRNLVLVLKEGDPVEVDRIRFDTAIPAKRAKKSE